MIDILKEHYRTLQGAMKNHKESLVGRIVLNGTHIHIPDNVTNGDVMKIIFPNMKIEKHCSFARFIYGEEYIPCPYSWLNATYQKEYKNEINN